jgi:PilZ domain
VSATETPETLGPAHLGSGPGGFLVKVRPMLFWKRTERRRCERIPVEMRAELRQQTGRPRRFPGETGSQWRGAEILDLSFHGVRIRAERLELRRGNSVDLLIVKESDRHRRPARVIWVKGGGGDALEAGLEFV